MSLLHQRVNEYLALRRAMGFKLREHGLLLPRFADFVEQSRATTVSVDLMLDWATQPTGVDPFRWRSRLSVVRGFARYLRVLDPATQVPPPRLLAYRPSRPTPFLFSDEEVRILLDATEQLRPPFRAVTYRTVFGLLAVTGLRVTEWYRDGVDVAARLPLLAAWLGHTHPASTYWYLQATPELLGEAARRLESSQVSSS